MGRDGTLKTTMTSVRAIVAMTAVAAFLALAVGVLSIASRPAVPPPCPACGSPRAVFRYSTDTFSVWTCDNCGKPFDGPASGSISWTPAFEHWLSDEQPLQ